MINIVAESLNMILEMNAKIKSQKALIESLKKENEHFYKASAEPVAPFERVKPDKNPNICVHFDDSQDFYRCKTNDDYNMIAGMSCFNGKTKCIDYKPVGPVVDPKIKLR